MGAVRGLYDGKCISKREPIQNHGSIVELP